MTENNTVLPPDPSRPAIPLMTEANFLALVQRVGFLEHLMVQNATAHVTTARVFNALIDRLGLALVGFNRDKARADLKAVWDFWRRVRAAGQAEAPPEAVRLDDVDTEGTA